jgi:hypothetical protein
MPLLLAGLVVLGLARALGWAWRRAWVLPALVVVATLTATVLRHGWRPVVTVVALVVAVLALAAAAWSWLEPGSFDRHAAGPVRSWHRRRYYAARWDAAMDGAGLVRAETVPLLMSVRGNATVDELLVHIAPGSLVTEWRDAAPRLASALEVRSVRVRRAGPRDVRLLVRHAAVSWRESQDAIDAELAEVVQQPATETNDQLAERLVAEAPAPTELPRPEHMPGGAFPRRPR